MSSTRDDIWTTEDYETGTCIDEFPSREAALRAVARYEAGDMEDGTYEEGFYAIRHAGACERIVGAEDELASFLAHRAMGRIRSARKAAASRANGAKGGRPRKQKQEEG